MPRRSGCGCCCGATALPVGRDAAVGAGAGVVVLLAMIVTAGIVAVLVYRVVGLRILRTAWINLDKIWAAAFVVAGVFVWVG